MIKKLFFIILTLILISSFVLAQENVRTEIQQQTTLENNYSSFQFSAFFFRVGLLFILPFVILGLHSYLTYRGWKKSNLLFKICTIITLIPLLYFSFASVYSSFQKNMGLGVIGFIFIIWPFFGLVLISWLIGFLLIYLRNKNKTITNVVSISGLVFFSIVFLISVLGLFQIMPFYRWDVAGWFVWPFQLAIIIFFIVFTIIVNKK